MMDSRKAFVQRLITSVSTDDKNLRPGQKSPLKMAMVYDKVSRVRSKDFPCVTLKGTFAERLNRPVSPAAG
jgi:hypothetical protein